MIFPCIAHEGSLTHVQVTVGVWRPIVQYEDGSAVVFPLSNNIAWSDKQWITIPMIYSISPAICRIPLMFCLSTFALP
jgi:hypothetical protein